MENAGSRAEPPTSVTQDSRSGSGMSEEARTEFWASLALRHCRGLGARSASRLLRSFGSAYAAVQARNRWHEAGVNRGQGAVLASGSWRVTAREEWDRARDLSASIILWTDPEYPPLLRRIPDAPVLLYCRGDLSLLRSPGFAVVGSRKATRHGRAVAEYMARCLAACGMTVVSGMALGIDRVAHQAALSRVGSSIGVLGTGIDVLYPSENFDIFDSMERKGLLVSEFAPGASPQPGHFPVRNRIISGLSLGVLVVEAAHRSGSLITARLALEQNREVYAVPGPALDAHCLGCQDLVRQGARAVFSAEDVLRDLAEQLKPYGISESSVPEGEDGLQTGTAADAVEPQGGRKPSAARAARHAAGEHGNGTQGHEGRSESAGPGPFSAQPMNEAEQAAAERLAPADTNAELLQYLHENGPAHADVLANAVGLSAAAANTALIGLEMLGRIRRLPGARYEATS